MPFRSETLPEARDRLAAQTQAENEGAKEAARGTVTLRRGRPTDPNSIEGIHLQLHGDARALRSTNDVHEAEVGEDGPDLDAIRQGRNVDEVEDEANQVNEGVSQEQRYDEAVNADFSGNEGKGEASGQSRSGRGRRGSRKEAE
jgi:hypothetical protein